MSVPSTVGNRWHPTVVLFQAPYCVSTFKLGFFGYIGLSNFFRVTICPIGVGNYLGEAFVSDQSGDSTETHRLLMKTRFGDRHAFNELFERHRHVLRRIVQLRLGHELRRRIDASDVVQEAQLEAFRRFDDYLQRRPMPFGLWLRKTAQERIHNHYRDHLQTARRSIRRELPFPDQSSLLIAAPFIDRGSSPSQRMLHRERNHLVTEAVHELGDVDREILLMRNVEGLTQSEIAQVLDLSHDAVRKRYGRALIKLQRFLAAKGLMEIEP